MKVINGTANLKDFLVAGMSFDVLQDFNYKEDINTMFRFFESKEASISTANAKQAISDMFNLLDIVSKLPYVPQLCYQYQLHGCTTDPNFLTLHDMIKVITKQEVNDDLTGKNADIYFGNLCKIFCCSNDLELDKCLALFKTIAICSSVYHFIKSKGFYGPTGKFDFWSQLELVTNNLQDEDYCNVALKALASTYEYVILFMDAKQNFVSLVKQIHKLIKSRTDLAMDFQKDMCQLEAVNSSITAVRFCFSTVIVS